MTVPVVDHVRIQQAVQALGITPADFDAIRRASFPQAQDMLQALKDRAKKNYKRLVFELHPDRTGNDPGKTELFKILGQVITDIEKLQVQPPPPPPQFVRVQVPLQWVQVARTVNGTTTTTVAGFHPGHVVFMRPGF